VGGRDREERPSEKKCDSAKRPKEVSIKNWGGNSVRKTLQQKALKNHVNKSKEVGHKEEDWGGGGKKTAEDPEVYSGSTATRKKQFGSAQQNGSLGGEKEKIAKKGKESAEIVSKEMNLGQRVKEVGRGKAKPNELSPRVQSGGGQGGGAKKNHKKGFPNSQARRNCQKGYKALGKTINDHGDQMGQREILRLNDGKKQTKVRITTHRKNRRNKRHQVFKGEGGKGKHNYIWHIRDKLRGKGRS